ncbi:dienelactone hydrolase family protein [Acrocarpospora catenulata]|uniref:dienelactone hydrolase family protein n=1 Tax=Acrocarpospora catenulata TaxID=2836182 RepID=UPI001BD9B35E|nr:dienelactone hydrolase family protein [Acrocarpospora catenulata]
MTPFQRYLAEEVAEDHVDGIIPRREAMRRLGLLGFSVPAAVALLAACGAPEEGAAPTPTPAPPSSATPATPATPAGPSPLPTEEITFDGPASTLMGAFAAAPSPRGAVLVIHENRGLNDHTRSVAGRLAAAGYSALALDLLSREGGTTAVGEPGEATAALNAATPERFIADMKAALDELTRRTPGAKLGAVGFCFGGGMTWLLLSSGEPRLAAAAPFYGPLPDNANFSGTEAAVLGVYAEDDARVNATRDAATTALQQANLQHEIVTYPNAGHAFFNDTGPRYNPTAAVQSWEKLTTWFDQHLA